MDLEKFYSVFPWPMRPEDPRAQRRFSSIVDLFNFLIDNHPFFKFLKDRERVKILDVMAGSGIAGAALAKVLTLRNLKVSLTVSDVRASDLSFVYEWLKGVNGVEVETLVAEVSKIHEAIPERAGYYDIVLL
ncbi:MAG: hypothetical protein P3X22_006125 [Thermoprotei archaeon]|nr:hypothetical protein [Thermoprotei archaeon]